LRSSVKSFETPILLLTYNKVDTTKAVLNQILKQNPKYLIISSDGPKTPESYQQVHALRDYFDKKIKFPFTKIYSDTNRGCKEGVEHAITEAFKIYEELIILEDDTLPSTKFFTFSASLLNRYRDEEEVNLISGYNYLSRAKISDPFFFSKYTNIWGWATWKNRWESRTTLNPKNLNKFIDNNEKSIFFNKLEEEYFLKHFSDVAEGKLDSWAFGLTFSNLKNKKVSIVPKYNLVKNLGLGHKEATHTKNRTSFRIVTPNLRFNLFQSLNLPLLPVLSNNIEDEKYFLKVISKKTIYNKLTYKIFKILRIT
jgi:hypothetical protein